MKTNKTKTFCQHIHLYYYVLLSIITDRWLCYAIEIRVPTIAKGIEASAVDEWLRHPLWSITLANGASEETPGGLLAVNRSNLKVEIVSCTICLGSLQMTARRNKLTAGYFFSFTVFIISFALYFYRFSPIVQQLVL